MSDAKIRAIIKRPDERYGHVTNISPTLRNLQRIVGGHIETVSVGFNSVLICNEEGKLRNLPRNFYLGSFPYGDTIVGEVVVVGVDGEEFCDCPIEFKAWKYMIDKWGNQ